MYLENEALLSEEKMLKKMSNGSQKCRDTKSREVVHDLIRSAPIKIQIREGNILRQRNLSAITLLYLLDSGRPAD